MNRSAMASSFRANLRLRVHDGRVRIGRVRDDCEFLMRGSAIDEFAMASPQQATVPRWP